ncbi:MAG: HAD hydrolase-like protein [Eubacteriales bacterium]|nr:HAD hydrolase-like protein [Eubacteriales bacterium]MDD4326882.1 HAD hydrolase-like protein [Eubacteriales bacterium]MDD4717551.1 HAD hydrolase-like protein [Eubacteriales bacterium]
MSIMKIFLPDKLYHRAADVDFRELYDEGKRVLLIDVDNTLITHGGNVFDEYAYSVISKAENHGLMCILFSNAKTSRIKDISDITRIEYIHRPFKPSGKGIKSYLREHKDISSNEIVVIGDQIFTDILAGNLAGVMTILVDPMYHNEPRQIRLKRYLEKFVKNRVAIDKISPVE